MHESEELEKQYNEIIECLDEETSKKFSTFISNVLENLSDLANYAEVDVDEWGNPIF